MGFKEMIGRLNAFITGLFTDHETVDYINGADQLPPPLSAEEERKFVSVTFW